MKVVITVLALAIGVASGAGGAWFWMMHGMSGGETAEQGKGEVLYYRHPMDSSITSDTPDKDSMGMDYIPVYEESSGGGGEKERGTVSIRPQVSQNLGVRYGDVALGDLRPQVQALGFVTYDEAAMVHTHVRTQGWVEELRVRTTGEVVKAGQILFLMDSPQLRNAQEELLHVLRRGGNIASYRSRLRVLGMAEQDIARLVERGESRTLVPVRARRDGVVESLNIAEGMTVGPDMTLVSIADLSRVWVMLEVFEADMDLLRAGQSAEVTLPFRPGVVHKAEVAYVYPNLNPQLRTQRARLELANPDGELSPGMLARVALSGETLEAVVHVPAEAVIRTGEQDRVVVTEEEGRFQVREVALGRRVGDRYVVQEGLEAGERLVVSGQFLIDSEASDIAELRRMQRPEGESDEGSAGDSAGEGSVWTTGELVALSDKDDRAMFRHEPVPEWGWPAMTMEFRLSGDLDRELPEPGTPLRLRMREHPEGGYEIDRLEAADEKENESGEDQSRHQAPVPDPATVAGRRL